MPEKPSVAYDYKKENVELVRQTCLYVATKLGDFLDDLVVVGGLVPSLLIPDESLPAGEDVHIGTMDLDLGLSLAILDRKRYEDLTIRLHRSGFTPDENEEGNPTLQRWKVSTSSGLKVTVDFLIPPSLDADKGGGFYLQQKLEKTPSLETAIEGVRLLLNGHAWDESTALTRQIVSFLENYGQMIDLAAFCGEVTAYRAFGYL